MLDVVCVLSSLTYTLSRCLVNLGVAVFPIGVGDRYDEAQLKILAGPGVSSNVVKLQQIEDLPALVTLGNSFFHKLCSGKLSDMCFFQFSDNYCHHDHY